MTIPGLTARQALRRTFAWLADERARRWLGSSWDACRLLLVPSSEACLLDGPDFQVVQTAAAAVVDV